MRPDRDAAWLPKSFLSMSDRPIHLPLPTWTSILAQRIDELRGDRAINVGPLTECFNQTALLQVMVGDNEAARMICMAQLQWIARLSRTLNKEDTLAFALQPWVNLGRLHRLEQATDRSLEYFSLAVAFTERREVKLGPCTVQASAWESIVRVYDLVPLFLWTVFIVDSYKAYAASRDFCGATQLLASQKSVVPSKFGSLISEADVLRLLAEGRFEEALTVASCTDTATVQEATAFLVYEMACHIGRNDLRQATAYGMALNSLCASEAFATLPAIGRINLLTQIGILHESVGDEGSAAIAYIRGFELAAGCNDTKSVMHLGRRLSERLEFDAERWQAHYEQACATSGYVERARNTWAAQAGPNGKDPGVHDLYKLAMSCLQNAQ